VRRAAASCCQIGEKLGALDNFTIKPEKVLPGNAFGGLLRITLLPVVIIYIIFAAVQYAQAPDIVNSETVTSRSVTDLHITAEFAPWLIASPVRFPPGKLRNLSPCHGTRRTPGGVVGAGSEVSRATTRHIFKLFSKICGGGGRGGGMWIWRREARSLCLRSLCSACASGALFGVAGVVSSAVAAISRARPGGWPLATEWLRLQRQLCACVVTV
jgi:hypothetical protein